MARRVAGYLVLGILILGGVIALLRMRPGMTEDQYDEAREGLESVRTGLDGTTCERPALFGPAQDDALPLDEFFASDGPFGGCWAAAADEEVRVVLRGTQGLDREAYGNAAGDLRHVAMEHALYTDYAPPPSIAAVVAACEALAAELLRQAQSADRCWPVLPTSSEWSASLFDAPRFPLGETLAIAAGVIARRLAAEGDVDAALRVIVQGIAVLRDKAAGTVRATAAADAVAGEALLAGTFQTIIDAAEVIEPAQIHAALGSLEAMPVDVYSSLATELVYLFDVNRDPRQHPDPENSRFWSYMVLKLVPRIQADCPPETDIALCHSHFPYVNREDVTLSAYVLGLRAAMPFTLGWMHEGATHDYPERLSAMVRQRGDAALMRELTLWTTGRAAGRCPEASEEWTDDPDAVFVASDDDGHFQLVGPSPLGAERSAFYFNCSPSAGTTADEAP